MSNFEWRTDEDGVDESLQLVRQMPPGTRRRRLILLVLLLAVAASATGYWLYRAGREHVAETTARVEEDVRASHELVRQAGLAADLELFQRFLSSANPDWAQAEERMVVGERWLDRTTLHLNWQQTISATAAITLSADLLEAEVVSHESYRFVDASGEEQTAPLAQTRVYRRGPDRWLLAPPREEFWGEETVILEPHLRLAYPARDAVLARRLARDLSALIQRACDVLADLDCPSDYRLAVRFARDPSLLQHGQPGTLPLWTERPLALPAPSLIGLPLEDMAYRALFLGYARQVTAVAIGELVGWRCCQPGLYFQVLLEQQWQQLGLAPEPQAPPPDVYHQMLQAQVDLINGSVLWAAVPVQGETLALQSVRIIVDFLQQRFPGASTVSWQRALSRAERYPDWISTVTGDQVGPALAMGWHSYLYTHAGDDDASPGPARPEEDVLLRCELPEGGRTLMRFDIQTETFTRVLPDPPLAADDKSSGPLELAPPDGAFVAEHGDGGLRIWRWQEGERQLIWEGDAQEDKAQGFVGASPDGRLIVIQEQDAQRRVPIYRLAEVARCLEDGCNWRQSIYRPTWSPDGRYVINADSDDNVLFLAETYSALQPFWYMDVGAAPLWLDEETFAYVRHAGGELMSVAMASVEERRVETLLEIADLHAQLPPGTIVAPTIGMARHPGDGNVLFLAVQTIRSNPPTSTYVFLARRDTQQLFNLFSVSNGDPASLSISPAGRWLAVESDEGLLLYDLVADRGGAYTEGAQRIPALWSSSGEWLLTGGEGIYYLIAPGSENREVRADSPICDDAVWLESD